MYHGNGKFAEERIIAVNRGTKGNFSENIQSNSGQRKCFTAKEKLR
jgi:hypothetical protein